MAGDRRCRFGSAASTVSVPDVDLPAGLRGEASLVVTEADTARSLGSGTVDVLGTPRLLALCEHATCSALDGQLPEGSTSVGMRIQVDHLQPTPVGAEVTAEAVLDKVEGRRVVFTVSATDPGGLVAAGRVTRALVDLERFMSRCCTADKSPS